MTRSFEYIVKDILSHHGAIVEENNDIIETLLPLPVAQTLNTSELLNICFRNKENAHDAIHLTHDSELFEGLGNLFKEKGRFTEITIQPGPIKSEKILTNLSDKIPVNNAVFKHIKTEEKNISYFLIFFKYTALSDEKQEGITQLLINGLNLTTHNLNSSKGTDILDEIISKSISKDEISCVERNDITTVMKAACKSTNGETVRLLDDFIKSLNRRLNRNIQRVNEYYYTMIYEVEQRIKKKKLIGVDKEKALNKIKAIKNELKWKVNDQVSKFALNIKNEHLSTIKINVPTSLFWINIKRRKGERKFPLAYNPILKQIDPLPCESCFFPQKPYYICDEKLHITGSCCFNTCGKCEKKFCVICSPDGCPRCKKIM